MYTIAGWLVKPEEVLVPVELELEAIVSLYVGAGTWTQV